MAFQTAARNAAAAAVGGVAGWVSFHTADPGGTGTNEVTGGTYSREQTTYGSPAGGSVVGSQVTADIPAATTITHWGLWSAASGGTWQGGWALTTPESYGGAGQYLFTPTITAT